MQKITRALLLLYVASAVAATNETISESTYKNITGGNQLWDGLIRDCQVPTMSCIQKNVYHYLDDTFAYRGDYTFAQILHFKRNSIDYNEYANKVDHGDEDDSYEKQRSTSPLEEVTEALHDKSLGFLMSHDMEMQLPDTLFDGSTIKVSPRSIEGDGVIVKLDLIPKQLQQDQSVGRILFKKIRKFFKNKLLMAFMSIVMVIGLIKAKLMFLMPLIVGVGTAKKIILKLLLFVFPALSHLFKLCTYYHDSYHGTKYHHHHHQIAHVHHVPSHHHPSEHHHTPEHHHPPEHIHGVPPDPIFKHEHEGFEYSGPGLGPEFISNRNTYDHTPSMNDENELKSWGLGHVQGHKGGRRGQQPKPPSSPTHNHIDDLALQAEREVSLKARLQQEQHRLRQENIRLQVQLRQELKLQEQLKLQAMMIAKHKTKLNPQQTQTQIHQPQLHRPQVVQQTQLHYGVPPRLQVPQQVQVQSVPKAATPSQMKPSYDSFYNPILEKIDKIFASLGINDEPCRERLVCSMYKNPIKFSPHSNLISAELSRDSKDLQKPTTTNDAVVRFYNYVQAARDGQDQKECLRMYPSCNINTDL